MLKSIFHGPFVTLVLTLPSLNSCIVANERRHIAPRHEVKQSAEAYLAEIEKGATAVGVIQSLFSIPGVLEQVPVPLVSALSELGHAMRFTARPNLQRDDQGTVLKTYVMPKSGTPTFSGLELKGRFSGEDAAPSLEMLQVSRTLDGTAADFVVFKKDQAAVRAIDFDEILRLFGPTTDPNALVYESGVASYSTESSGLIVVQGVDIAFFVRDVRSVISFTVSVDERTGAIAGGTLSAEAFDRKTNELRTAFEWNLETLVEKLKNWQTSESAVRKPVL